MLSNYEEIVTNFASPICVIAGPGAGKTHLLADRVTRLLKDGVDKDNVMVLAFGKDASARMKNELTNPNEPWKLKNDELPHISTMHSLGLEIVKTCPGIVGLLGNDPKTQEDDKIKQLMFRDAALLLGLEEKEATKQAIKCKL
jgi:superfamily I DNA/RNA helicase